MPVASDMQKELSAAGHKTTSMQGRGAGKSPAPSRRAGWLRPSKNLVGVRAALLLGADF